ncbi:MAG: efflux RND transporter permease subunit, partial [Deltaproteobacteria bacterium]|nr:efflux RND transporter permease subunit [Nannocystaceae bacterium]
MARRYGLSDLALARPVTTGMLLVAVVLLGIIGLAQMPLSFLPREEVARVFVKVDITRTSPEVLERELIRPLEESVAGLRGLQRVQVGSGAWGVRMNLEFEAGTDADARKLELRDRVDKVRGELPEFVQKIEIGSHSNDDEPVMEMQISSGADLSEDYYLIESHVVRAIERAPGVARVELEGVAPHELEVAVDIDASRRSGVSLVELGEAVRAARQGRSMGLMRQSARESGVRSPSETASAER